MATITTGTWNDSTQTVVILLDEYEHAVEHLEPDDARRLAIKLIEAAHHIDKPQTATEWP